MDLKHLADKYTCAVRQPRANGAFWSWRITIDQQRIHHYPGIHKREPQPRLIKLAGAQARTKALCV